MTEREALLKAVCDNPDDDTPRLVFADWLQEHGDEARAEFIRLEVRLQRGRFRPYEEARLNRRRHEFREHVERWKAEARGAEDVRFYRGFVEQATFASAADFERSLQTSPLRRVKIRGSVDLPALLRLPGVCRVACVVLTAPVAETDLVALAEGKWPNRPMELLLSSSGVSTELMERVTERHGGWAWFPSLLY
jgi:uncharacterized protein (TIGR02996 family)